MFGLKRRDFITLLGGAAAAWPLAAARAQQMPVIGFLHSQTAAEFAHLVSAFRRGLNEAGYVESRNVAIEFRWAEGRTAHLPALASELVGRQVTVIVASGGSSFAAKAATTTIPIVCSFGGDPVELGLVSSLNRPGGNLTGVSIFTTTLEVKRLEMLHELVPRAALTGVLFDPKILHAERQLREIEAAARALGQPIRIMNVSSESDIHAAFAALVEARAGALAVTGNPFLNRKRDMIIALAAQHSLPTIYEYREAPAAGGLMSYGPSLAEVFRQIGTYTARILNGEKPGDLPVLQPAKFELLINLKTAKALGLTVPNTLLVTADEVIE